MMRIKMPTIRKTGMGRRTMTKRRRRRTAPETRKQMKMKMILRKPLNSLFLVKHTKVNPFLWTFLRSFMPFMKSSSTRLLLSRRKSTNYLRPCSAR
ncbi:hypothetical protein H0H92_002193, partial [Tricholoma furcatifolium]